MPDEKFHALSIDGSGRKTRAVTSNPAILFTGILHKALADAVVARLMKPDMLTPRRISTQSFPPAQTTARSYHRGSPWPDDNGMTAMGTKCPHVVQVTPSPMRC